MPKEVKKRSAAPSASSKPSISRAIPKPSSSAARPAKKSASGASVPKSTSTPAKRKPAPAPVPTPAPAPASSSGSVSEASASDAESSSAEEEEPAALHGFSSDDSDSDSDDDEIEVDENPVDVAKLPTIAKDDATVKRKLAKAAKQPGAERGVVYLGRIPHGFYEDQMRGYFGQFGEVTRVRLARNKKTGRSKHYAFLEFASRPVAEIVCETMNNYLLLGHIISCELIPSDRVHPELWVGSNRKWRKVPHARVARVSHNRERDEEAKAKVEKRLLSRQRQKQKKLAAAGIEYDLSSVGYSITAR